MRCSQANSLTDREAAAIHLDTAATALWQIPAARRPGVLVRALACVPEISLEASFASGSLRAALSSAWEAMAGTALPIDFLRGRLECRDDEMIISAICNVALAESQSQLGEQLAAVLQSLHNAHASKRSNKDSRFRT
jgi:hypothetical protein